MNLSITSTIKSNFSNKHCLNKPSLLTTACFIRLQKRKTVDTKKGSYVGHEIFISSNYILYMHYNVTWNLLSYV